MQAPKRKQYYSGKTFVFYRALLVVVLLMVGVLALGTIYAFARPPGSAPLFRIGNAENAGITNAVDPGHQTNFPMSENIGIFSGIGRLRIPLADSSILIISITFPYHLDDRAFGEELTTRTGDFRTIATEYFSSLSIESLANLSEEAARAEILRLYNASLRLGRIETLFFNDLMIIE